MPLAASFRSASKATATAVGALAVLPSGGDLAKCVEHSRHEDSSFNASCTGGAGLHLFVANPFALALRATPSQGARSTAVAGVQRTASSARMRSP